MDVLAIIPARGGSKGIPRKNVLPLAGKPLIAHAIAAALRAQRVTRVVVSTDDQEIAQVARYHGAEVVMRPPELAGDMARSEDALLHVLEVLEAGEGYRPEVIAFLQCTSPLTAADDIDATIAAVTERGADSAFTAVPFHYFLWSTGPQGVDGINHDKSVRPMRQERAPEWLETGSVYAMRTAGFRQSEFRFFGTTLLHEIPLDHWQEIDEPADFRIAEERMLRLRRARAASGLPARIGALVMDFDGVLTDDRVWVDQDGRDRSPARVRTGWGSSCCAKRVCR